MVELESRLLISVEVAGLRALRPFEQEGMGVSTYPMSRMMTVEDGCVRLHLGGELCTSTAPSLMETLVDLCGIPLRSFVIDLRAVTFADVRGLRCLVEAARLAGTEGAAFQLANVPSHMDRTIRAAGFERLLGLPDSELARRSAGPPPVNLP